MTFCRNYVVVFWMLSMSKKLNLIAMRDSLSLLVISALVTIILFVVKLSIISTKKIYAFMFNNQYFLITIDVRGLSLNLVPLMVCMPSSIFLAFLIYSLNLPRWFGYKNKNLCKISSDWKIWLYR